MEAMSVIRSWAESHQLPLQERDEESDPVKFLVLNGEEIPGELDIIGDVTVMQVGNEPASFAVSTCRGRMILDESWANTRSLPAILDSALGLLKRRVKTPSALWALAVVDATNGPVKVSLNGEDDDAGVADRGWICFGREDGSTWPTG